MGNSFERLLEKGKKGSRWKVSWLLAVFLFVVGWLLIDSGTQFFGFLLIVAGVLSLFVTDQKTSAGHARPATAMQAGGYGYQPPIIVRAGHTPPMQSVKMRIKEPWFGTANYEDAMAALSDVVLLPVKVLWRLLRIGRGSKKKTDGDKKADEKK